MAGIYFHIPFCKQACHYCDFYFSTTATYQDQMVDCMISEMKLHSNWELRELESIYLGGGTPSLLSISQIERLINGVKNQFQIKDGAEITLEANPDDLTTEMLQGLKQLGFNRLSIGIQSFDAKSLQKINRAHSSEQAHKALHLASESGFSNVSADLIYGLPESSRESVKKDLLQLFDYKVPHISIYGLTVEKNTAFGRWAEKGKIIFPDEDEQALQMELIMESMENRGYLQYEISNFCLPGYQSRHNSGYWKSKPYLGIGPSAHSFDGKQRWFNVANNAHYIRSIRQGKIPLTLEKPTSTDRLNDYILTSLRTMEGCDLELINQTWGLNLIEKEAGVIDKWVKHEYLSIKENKILLSKKGRLLADEIAYELFQDEDI